MDNDLIQSLKILIKNEIRKELRLLDLEKCYKNELFSNWTSYDLLYFNSNLELEDEIKRELVLEILAFIDNNYRICNMIDSTLRKKIKFFDSYDSSFEDISIEYRFRFLFENNFYSIIFYFYDESEGRFVKINVYKDDEFIEGMEFNLQDFVMSVVIGNLKHILYGNEK
jgi:hypothetical protein